MFHLLPFRGLEVVDTSKTAGMDAHHQRHIYLSLSAKPSVYFLWFSVLGWGSCCYLTKLNNRLFLGTPESHHGWNLEVAGECIG